MILTCNSCGKKFVVPDGAITQAGRLVQCSACGNKWKQFPVKTSEKQESISKPTAKKNFKQPIIPKKPLSQKKPISPRKKVIKKTREINLYSPEYLAKKHGIKIKDSEPKNLKKSISKKKVSFGFYSSLIVFIVLLIFFSRSLYFAQNLIITLVPSSEFYLGYFFENIRNVFEIWKGLLFSY